MLPFPRTATRIRAIALSWGLVALTAHGRDAVAQPKAGLATRLDVVAETSCATQADLMARVRSRAPRATFDDEPGALFARARFSTPRSGVVVVDLTLTRPGATPSSRRVFARTCGEAEDAAALIIAVTLDPTAAQRVNGENESAKEASSDESRSAETPEHRNPETTVRSPPAKPPLPDKAAPVSTPEKKSPAASADTTELHSSEEARSETSSLHGFVQAELAGAALAGPAPGLMPAVTVYVLAGLDEPGLLSPALLVGGTLAWRAGVEAQGGDASFRLDAVSFDACPLRWRWASVEARPCAGALVGRLATRGANTTNPSGERSRPFGALGGAGLATLKLVGPWEASARVAIGANLVRDRFEFGSDIFHRVGPLTLAASLGLGARLP